jgi:DNA-binding IclR family transcriptional regulator
MTAEKTEPSARRRGRPRQSEGDTSWVDQRPFVSSLARGLSILRSFRTEDRVLGTHEIARRTNLPNTTVSRLLGTLTHLGYLRYIPEYGKYALSNQVVTLGFTAIGRFGFGERVRKHMEAIAAAGECAVAMSARDTLHMMFVELIRKPTATTLNLHAGARIPLAETAPGRAYLFATTEAERADLLGQLAEVHGAAWAAAIRPRLERALERMARQGYSDSFGDWHAGHNAIGVPILDPLTGDIYTLSLGGHAQILTPARIRRIYVPMLLGAAQEIAALGGR